MREFRYKKLINFSMIKVLVSDKNMISFRVLFLSLCNELLKNG